MKTEIVSQEKNFIEAKAEFTPEETKKAVESTYRKIGKDANIKGFRKGKVPRHTLELYFPKESVRAEATQDLVNEAIDKMIEEYELKLISEPEVQPAQIADDDTFEVTVKFEVSPEFELPDFGEIEVDKIVYDITDDMVKAQLERILDANAEIVPTYEERPLTKDDYASVSFDTFGISEDGTEFKTQEGQKTEIFLGSASLVPQVSEALIGKTPGETVTVDIPIENEETVKKNHVVATRFEIEILGIMKREIPELTDDFAAKVSEGRFPTAEALKEEIKRQLTETMENNSKENLKETIVDKLADMIDFEVPASLLNRQKEAAKKHFANRVMKEKNMSLEDYFKQDGIDKEAIEKEMELTAYNSVKQALILEAVADANNIEWTPEELNAEIKSLARMSGVEPQRFEEYIYADRNRIFEIAERVRNRKAADFLTTAVKVKEVNALDLAGRDEKKEEAAENKAE